MNFEHRTIKDLNIMKADFVLFHRCCDNITMYNIVQSP